MTSNYCPVCLVSYDAKPVARENANAICDLCGRYYYETTVTAIRGIRTYNDAVKFLTVGKHRSPFYVPTLIGSYLSDGYGLDKTLAAICALLLAAASDLDAVHVAVITDAESVLSHD